MVGDIFQPTHLLFVLVVALLVLGPKRLPEVARTLGKGIRDFRGAISGEGDDAPRSFLGQDHNAPAPAPPVPYEAPAAEPVAATASTEPAVPHDAPTTAPEPAAAAPVTPATTTPDAEPAADPQPAVPTADTPAAVTPATTTPGANGDDAPATAVHPAGARAEQPD